jgi:YggT family protein
MSCAILNIINWIFSILTLLIVVDVIGSWILAARARLPDAVYRLLGFVHSVTTPILAPIQRLIPPLGGMDFSPIIALLGLRLLQWLIGSALTGLR